MHSIIIVDDEVSTHESLKDYIEQVIGGFKVIGCFKNGSEAIDFLKNNSVDIVITDIKMPKVSGLELAKYVHENMPMTKVVIVSGYGEFEYARQAIVYNVYHYLLKAIDLRELSEVLKKLVQELEMGKKKIGEFDYTILREAFCTDLIVGWLEGEEIEAEYRKCNMPYPMDAAKIAAFKCSMQNYKEQLNNKWNYGIDSFDDAIKGTLQSVINEYNGGIVIEINKNTEEIIFAVVTDFAISGIEKILEENLLEIMGIRCEIIKIIDFCGIRELGSSAGIFNANELYKIMISYIKLYGTKRAKKIIKRVMMLMNYEDPQGKKLTIIDNNGNIYEDVVYKVIGARQSKEKIIESAKAYIHSNYMNDISYTDVADKLNFNSVYFSRYFKQQTGMTIRDYILEIRMRKAIEYLNTNMKISEISEKCSYKNIRTFQRIFKNYTGYSPIEYKKQVLRKI